MSTITPGAQAAKQSAKSYLLGLFLGFLLSLIFFLSAHVACKRDLQGVAPDVGEELFGPGSHQVQDLLASALGKEVPDELQALLPLLVLLEVVAVLEQNVQLSVQGLEILGEKKKG